MRPRVDPRRCGWFDAVVLKRVIQINSISGLAITKLDVLDGLEEIALCIDYEKGADGENKPVYETVPGWTDATTGIRNFDDLPVAAQSYIKHIQDVCGIPVDIVSTGPDREETIVLKEAFAELAARIVRFSTVLVCSRR